MSPLSRGDNFELLFSCLDSFFQTTLPECVLAAQFNALMHLQQALLLSSGADFLDMTGCRHPCVTEEVEIIYNTDIL